MRNKEATLTPAAEEPQSVQRTPSATEPSSFPAGAMIRGKLLARKRREVKSKDGKLRYLITLTTLAKQGVFLVDRWSDVPVPEDLPVVGQDVTLPIRISAYVQAGVPKVRIGYDDGKSEGAF